MGKVVKYCSTCEEGFAEKFGFCPNCGAELQAFEMNPLGGNSPVEEPKSEPVKNEEAAAPVVETPAEEPQITETREFSANAAQTETPATEETFEFDDEIFEEPIPETKAFEAPKPLADDTPSDNLYQATYAKAADEPVKETIPHYEYQGGYQPTIVVEKNVKQRNTLLLGFFVLGCTLMVGSYVYSVFNKLLDIAAIDTPNLVAYVGEVDPTAMELEEEKKKDDDKGGGGGGGGKEEQERASKGKLAAQSPDPMIAPSSRMTPLTNPTIPIQAQTQNKNLRPTEDSPLPYGLKNGGDTLSDGSGSGGGLGNGKGRGQGDGQGGGIGPGIGNGRGGGRGDGEGDGDGDGDGDTPNFTVKKNVEPPTPLKIISKPRANYTDAARQAQVQGTVILRVTFSATGSVGQISVVKGLGNGLTEQAIAAARGIRFEPAKRGGVPYAVTKNVEYSFTIY